MIAHFFDLDTILMVNAKVWIVDKTIPNIPIMKISKSDFNLIRNGIYKSQGNSVDFAGHTYWLPTTLYENLKIRLNKSKSDISNIAFSMQEFLNKELIENLEYSINLDNIIHLKNTDDHIYVICSKNAKDKYELMLSKIEDKLKENGLLIKDFYFISETFYNRDMDDIAHKKVRLLLQHIIGLKTDDDKFTDEEITQYDNVYFYDDDNNSINLAIDINKLLMFFYSNSEDGVKKTIREKLNSAEIILFVNKVTGNRVNKFVKSQVAIQLSNLIKTFESFKNFKYRL